MVVAAISILNILGIVSVVLGVMVMMGACRCCKVSVALISWTLQLSQLRMCSWMQVSLLRAELNLT